MHYECLKCGYICKGRKQIGNPAKCPKCNSKRIVTIDMDSHKVFDRYGEAL